MSVKVQGWVWDQPLPTSQKIVLLKLADHADHEGGNVYPSVSSLAATTGLSERQVQRYLKTFVAQGLLEIESNEAGGRGKTRVYRFTFRPIDPPVSARKGDTGVTDYRAERVTPTTPLSPERVTSETEKGDTGDAKRVTPVTEKGDIHAHANQNRQEPSPEPSGNRGGTQARPSPPKRGTTIPEDFELTDRLLAWGNENGFTPEQMRSQVPRFVDHYLANGETRKDWTASFRTWMHKARDWGHLDGTRSRASPLRQPPNLRTHGHDEDVDWLGDYAPAAKGSSP